MLTVALAEGGGGTAAGGREAEHPGHVERYGQVLGGEGGAEAVHDSGVVDSGLHLPAAGLGRQARRAAGLHVIQAVAQPQERHLAIHRRGRSRGGRPCGDCEREEEEEAHPGGAAG